MLPNGLTLFIADIIDEETDTQCIWYVVGKTYNSAFKRFKREADKLFWRYAYYFYEADNDDIKEFAVTFEKI